MQYRLVNLIADLQQELDAHGDRDVILYQSSPEIEIPDFDVEYNEDGSEPVVLISF